MTKNKVSRSDVMRSVKGKNTTPEIKVRKIIHRMGYRFRLHDSGLPGKPDLVLPKHHKIIFVNGCFWHGHKCKRGARIPKTNSQYWKLKISKNKARDTSHRLALMADRWGVLTIWECELKNIGKLERRIKEFLE